MNIQIFGKSKSFDTKKAERWFKERRIKYQYIDLVTKGVSPGEYRSIRAAVGSLDALVDKSCRAYEEQYMAYITPQAAEEKLLDYPELFAAPIVRNGRQDFFMPYSCAPPSPRRSRFCPAPLPAAGSPAPPAPSSYRRKTAAPRRR